ncbi:TetR/AcrR family transcriptional regulator [Flexivirga alba]|uniref:TetR/AcrR family transcriptional regulator n=1 Tax=Flexivirga alba TaxID=702742 RepID=A0ABW2AB59_9MICO
MARPAQPLDRSREDDLLRTAARDFASAGYAGTSLNNVITEAGWGKSSFYHYFANKRRLHDHVVHTLAARLVDGVRVPDIEKVSGAEFWVTMAELVEAFGKTARSHPETGYLGEMFHAPASDDDGSLAELREQVEQWLRRAVRHGRRVGAVRDDLPDDLLVELTLGTLRTLDRWAVRRRLHPEAADAPHLSIQLVRDLIERR